MSSLSSTATVRGLRAAIFAATAVVAIAVSGFSASDASAAVVCNGSNIIGEGSSAQRIAQQNIWTPAFQSEICNKETFPRIEYKPEGSGAGFNAWAANGGVINRTRAFIATDEALLATQIASIKAAAGGGNVVVIPTAQTAIAVIANPPSGCSVENITDKELEEVFRGIVRKWSELANALGSCEFPLTRVVRLDGSGTSYNFKHYLSLVNPEPIPCLEKTWKQSQPITVSETGKPNTRWPESCGTEPLSSIVRPAKNGEGEVVKLVAAAAGTIGFAALPDAETGSVQILNLQNNGIETPKAEATYASPQIPGKEALKGTANCSATKYLVPEEARTSGSGLDVEWSSVYGAQPAIGGTAYPLCMLTFDLAFHGYQAAGFELGQFQTVRDFFNGYVAFAGQEDLVAAESNYAPTPETKGFVANNVAQAMRYAASLISW